MPSKKGAYHRNPVIPPMRVLIIEDEGAIANLMEYFLEEEGFSIEKASDGKEGLEKIRERNFDLIVCDYLMPRMDGREFYEKWVREFPDSETQIFFITGVMTEGDNEASHFFSKYHVEVLQKPFDKEILIEKFREYRRKWSEERLRRCLK